MMALQPAHPAFAEGIAVATGNTTLNQAGNGVPIVDIAPPNGAGLSHNLYQDFNVGQAGVILNNATGQLTQTQLGGLIQNNPHLNGQAANLIINEVVGANPSQLQGYLEVAGQQAGVVVANPNGLTCDGCGFINTPNVTLSTGKPVLDAQGQLQALDVKQGTLTVGGKGLDATRQASVDLVARAVQLNGALHGQTVNVVAGANKVDRQTGEIVAQAGNGPAPEVAIDTAALGGMYAGKIRLVSTEQGVGVNLANVVAKQGDLTLDANGRVRLRDSAAQGQLTVNAQGNAELGGKLAAQGALTANATGDVTLSQSQLAADTVQLAGKQVTLSDSRVDARTATLAAKETLNQQGEVSAAEQLTLSGKTVALAGRQQSGGGVTLTASDGASLQGTLAAAGPVTIKSGHHWVQGKTSTLESQGRVEVEADEVTLSGRMQGQQIALNTKTLTSDASVTAGQTLAVNAQRATQQGVMHSQGQLDWRGEQLDNQGTLSADGTGELALAELSNGQTGQVLTKGPLTITSDTLTNQGKVVSEGALALTNKGALLNTGTLGGARLTLGTDRLDSRGMLLGRDGIALTGRELSSSGQLVSDGALTIGSQLLLLSGITKGQEVAIKVNQLALDGSLQGDSVALEADQIASGNAGQLLSQTTLKVTAREAVQEGTWAAKGEMGLDIATLLNRGTLASDAALRYQGNTLVNSGTVSTQSLDVQVQQLRSSGLLLAAQAGQITSHTLDNQGRLQAGGNLTLNTTELLNSNQLISGLALAITTGTFTNSGTTAAGSTLALEGTTLTNHGKWVAGDVLRVKADTITQGQTGITASNSALTIDATTLTGQGTYSASGPLTLKAATLTINGQLHSDDALTLDANQLSLAGTGYSKGDLMLRASDAALNGALTSGQDATLQLSGALHHNGRLNANQIAVSAKRVDGSGDLYAEKALNVSANQIAQGGTWLAKESASLTGDSLQLGGTLAALAGLTLNATSSLSSSNSAKVIAGTQLAVTAPTLQLAGRWQAGTGATVTAGQFTQPGDLVAGGTLQLNADNWQAQGVTQAAGTIDATLTGHGELGGRVSSHGDIHITANTLANRGELLGQGHVALTVQGMLLQLGTLMGQQSLTLGADQLDQQGEVIAGNSQVTARTLNQQGKWLGSGQFSYQGQQLDNSGQLQASDITLHADQTSNRGSVLAQNQLTLTGARLDNLGQWQAGAQTLTLNNLANGQGAQLRSQTNGIINAQQLDNAGQLVAQGALHISGNTLSNQTSGLISADMLSLQANSNLSSAGILFGLRQLLVTSATLDGGGQLLAGSKLGIDTGRVTQIGQWLSGGDLALKVGSSLTSQGNISAKNQLELDVQGDWQNQGQWVAGSGLRATATGTLDNRGKLISNGALQVGASSLDNSGSLQAGSTLRLDTSGALRNSGIVASLGDQVVSSASLYNSGTFYSGRHMLLGVANQLDNHTGTLLAEGDLHIRGLLDGLKAVSVLNRSGRIESSANLLIESQALRNERDGLAIREESIFHTTDVPLTIDVLPISISETENCNWGNSGGGGTACRTEYTPIYAGNPTAPQLRLVEHLRLTMPTMGGNEAMLMSQGSMTMSVDDIVNDASYISAGLDLNMYGSSLTNKGYQLGDTITEALYTYQGKSPDNTRYGYRLDLTDVATRHENTSVFNGVLSAGRNIQGSFTGQIDNVTIKANAGPVSSTTTRPELANVAVDGPSGPSWQAGSNAQQVIFTPVGEPNGVPLPDYPVPGGGNGLFVVTDKPDSQYLIEVNPLISELGSAGNAALSNIDQALAAAAQASGQWDGWQTINTAQPGALPNGSALTLAPSVEQNPTWTDLGKFLGSNYFFAQLNYNPERDIKLLGDAAFDTRVIRDAVLAQTGRRFINGEMGSDLAQMRWLIDNAAQNQRELGLMPGVALTAAQVAQLGRSMVWWEPVWFNGQIVLAPKLYLTEADQRHLSGSVITAGNIDLKAGGINNSGTLLADGTLSLKSGSTLTNQGVLQAGGDLTLLAMDDILNQGQISGQNVTLASANGSIINQTQTAQRHVDVNGILSDVLSDQTRFSRTDVGDTASITSAGNLLLQAGKDINLSAAELLAGGNMALQAGNDITIGSLENRHTWEEGQNRFSRIDQLMSELNAGGNLSLNAGNDLSLVASTADAKGDVSLSAGNNLVLASEANQSSDDVHQGSKHTIDRTTTQIGATVSGDNVSLNAGNNLLAQASTIEAQGNASLQASGELQLTTADNEEYHYEKSKSSGTFKSKTTEIEQRDVTAQGTAITAGGNVSLASQGDMTLKGSDIKATGSLAIDTEGQLKLLTATDEHFYRKDEQKKGITVTAQGNGTSATTERQNQLEGADITINAGQGVLLQVGQREGETLQANLTALASEPGMAWVNQVSQMPGVKMAAVQEAFEQWDYKQQSLNPVVAAVIAIAVAAVSGGAGAALLSTQTAVTTAMANTAFATLATQAAQSMVLHGGDLSAVLKDLGSSANIKQLATAVATAGALSGFDQWAKLDSAAKQANNPFAQPGAADLMSWDTFNRVTGHATIGAGINSTINGGSFGDAFKDSLLANIQGEVGKSTAGRIGDNGNALGEAGKTIAHGVTSGAIAEITGGKFAAGAAGGAMSELASNWSLGAFGGNEEYQVALNKVLGGLAAAAVTGDENDFNTGADRAETVYRYNLLEHQFDTMMAQAEQDRVKAGLGDEDAKARVEAREQLSDAINNLTLDLLPVVGDVKGFVEAQDTLDYALAAIAVIPGGDLLKGPLKAAKEALKAGDVETANKVLSGVSEVVPTIINGTRNLPIKDGDRLTEINKTLDRIDSGGPFPYKKDGTVFRNKEGKLPEGNYREYTVDTPGANNRGTRRVVQDIDTGRTYYTDDHYENFIQFDPTKR
ncbi:filamentous hemagglutinin N-terminal domain-containing protein (plasmid) [Aeromonas dhakensis]|uniref:two-partner secretion domain-containing protein n=1 Tax=Aeromonas dhakensis TaxID=196024 RepID=UPI0021B291D9|nr:ribonuclease domain-containing protein [Aeromonas dhakensis]UXB09947.1 filamentous hemagglutinin N-terminal domain-containing protein [Aeromonas dhakensis]